MTIDLNFWSNKRVFITGHTGFKGSWLILWLSMLDARVTGYALSPPTKPSLFELCQLDKSITSIIADIRDRKTLTQALFAARPEIVIHMAAQALVHESYQNPVETYAVNVIGTVNLLEAVRACPGIRAVINVTTDKCYENKEWVWGYRENEALGGYDPYSSSKACSELVTAAYRSSFFNSMEYAAHEVAVASARAGNVIGGGDWSPDRLVPDIIKALITGDKIKLRNPEAVRPWQHVLEPLSGYLTLAQKLYTHGTEYAEAWNFGPNDEDEQSVAWVVKNLCRQWGNETLYELDERSHPHEAGILKLDCSKAKRKLAWYPRWNLEEGIIKVVEWYKAYEKNIDLRTICLRQIEEYTNTLSERREHD